MSQSNSLLLDVVPSINFREAVGGLRLKDTIKFSMIFDLGPELSAGTVWIACGNVDGRGFDHWKWHYVLDWQRIIGTEEPFLLLLLDLIVLLF